MQSCAWTSRSHQQVGPPLQYSQAATQFTYNTARNLQAAAADTTCWNRTGNKANFNTLLYGHHSNRKPSNQQAAAAPLQAVSAERNDYYQKASQIDAVQHSSANAQSGYPNLPVTHGFQQDFSQNSAQDSSNQCPSSMAPDTAYPQQVKSAHWNQSVRVHREQSLRAQADTTAYNYQHCRDQNSLFHGFNGESTRPVSACTTTTTSPAPEEVVYTAAAYTRQTAHKHSARTNSTQHASPPSYHTTISQAAFRNNSITAKSSGQNLRCSSTNPKTQQYPTHKDSSIKSDIRRYYSLLLFSKMNGKNKIPFNLQQEMQKMRARIESRFARSSSRPKQFVIQGRMMESNKNMKPVASKVTEMCSLNSSQSLSLNSGQSLPNTTHSVTSTQHSVDVPPQQSSGPNVSASSLSNPEELLISPKSRPDGPGVEPYPYLENPNQMLIDASSDGAFVPDSARPQDFSQKQSCADDTGSELVIDMQVDQLVEVAAQQSVTCKVLMSRSNDEDKNEMPADLKEVFDLSSVPTTPWTHGALTKLIQDGEKAQMALTDVEFDFLKKLISMFWGGKILDLKDIHCNILQAEKFCRERVSPDSVILSQVKHGFEKQLKSYHVFKDNEVYSEVSYKSSWLNVNEQLDDIDKEFDFPQTLKHCSHALKSKTDQFKTDSSIPAQIRNRVSNKTSTELKPVKSSEKKQDTTVESTSTQMASPNETDSTDFGDSYSFKIQVLPPEEARVIFEQVSSKQPQSMDTDNQPERHTKSSVKGGVLRDVDATSSDTKLENDLVCPVQEFCCIALMKEMIWGSDTVSKCQCKYKPSHKNDSDKTPIKEVIAEEKKDFLSATEKNDLCYIIDLTEHEDQPPSYSIKELHSSSDSTSPNWSSVILSDENEDRNQRADFEGDSGGAQVKLTRSQSSGSDGKNISRSDREIQSNPEVDCGQGPLKSTGNVPLCCDKEVENSSDGENDVDGQMSDAENYKAAPLSFEEELTEVSVVCAQQTAGSSKHKTAERKRKRLSSHDRFFPIFKKTNKLTSLVDVDSQPVHEDASKCGKVFDDGEPSASDVRSAKLTLFGSTAKNKRMLRVSRKSHASSRAPEFLTVNLSPKTRKRRKTISTWNYSVKQLYKKWKISFPPSKINTESLTCSGKNVPCLKLKRMWSLTDEEEEMEKDTVTLNQHADEENGSSTVMPSQNNDVLKFCVLPHSFTFSDGFNGREDTSDSIPNKPDREGKDMTRSVIQARGTWCSVPQYFSPPTKRTHSLFHEFQEKYKEMTKLPDSTTGRESV